MIAATTAINGNISGEWYLALAAVLPAKSPTMAAYYASAGVLVAQCR